MLSMNLVYKNVEAQKCLFFKNIVVNSLVAISISSLRRNLDVLINQLACISPTTVVVLPKPTLPIGLKGLSLRPRASEGLAGTPSYIN